MPFRNVSEKSDTPAQAQPSDSGWLRRWWPVPAVALLVLLSAATWRLTTADTATAPAASKGQRGPDAANRPTPVAAQPATIQPSFEVMLGALGTVIARNTVTLHARVDGELVQVAFREGQIVHTGDLLAVITINRKDQEIDSLRRDLNVVPAEL